MGRDRKAAPPQSLPKVVYIPSRRRPHNVEKIVPRWLAQGYRVVFVLEFRDIQDYINALTGNWGPDKAGVLELPEPDRGIGYARNFALAHAHGRYRSIIMADDDVMPKTSTSLSKTSKTPHGNRMIRLQKCVELLDIVGCAAVHSYQDFLLQGFLKSEINGGVLYNGAIGRPVLAPNGSFGQCFAINVDRAVEIGGFDPTLTVAYEDNDFMMRSLARLKMPWAFHSGVWMDRLGGRFEKGGVADLCDMPDKRSGTQQDPDTLRMASDKYSESLLACRIRMREKWPDFTTDPMGRAFRIYWKRFYDGMLPSWRSQSAIHGGDLDRRVKKESVPCP